jgi:hypothetical protein
MPYFFLLISILLFATIAIQDFGKNEFYWFLPPAIMVVGVAKGVVEINFKFWYITTFINVLVLLSIAILLFGYYMAVKRLKKIKEGLGLGDILLLLALTTFFQPILFVLVLLLSAVSGLVFHIVKHGLKEQKLIPYAAWLSMYSVGFYIYEFKF